MQPFQDHAAFNRMGVLSLFIHSSECRISTLPAVIIPATWFPKTNLATYWIPILKKLKDVQHSIVIWPSFNICNCPRFSLKGWSQMYSGRRYGYLWLTSFAHYKFANNAFCCAVASLDEAILSVRNQHILCLLLNALFSIASISGNTKFSPWKVKGLPTTSTCPYPPFRQC